MQRAFVEDAQYRIQNSYGALGHHNVFCLQCLRGTHSQHFQVMIHHQEILVLCLAIDWMAVALRAPSLNKTSHD